MKFLKFLAAILFLIFPWAASSQDSSFGLSIPFAGTSYPLEVRLFSGAEADGKKTLRAEVNFQPVLTDLNGIIDRLGLNFPPGVEQFQSFSHNGTGGGVDGNLLWLKYHFRVDPHNSKPTNGSLEMWLTPVVVDNRIGLKAVRTKLNISNDIVRGVMEAFGIADELEGQFSKSVNEALSDSSISLPDFVASFGWELRGGEFIVDQGSAWLRINALRQ